LWIFDEEFWRIIDTIGPGVLAGTGVSLLYLAIAR